MLNRRSFMRGASAVAASGLVGMPKPGYATGKIKQVSFLGWSQDEPASKPTLDMAFDQFMKEHPDVKLDLIGSPWAQMQEAIQSRLRSGQSLQVVQLAERWLPTIAKTGRLLDLSTVFGKGELEKSIHPNTLKLGEYKGRQLSLPWSAGSIGMVANSKVLLDLGINKMPVTIDEFKVTLSQIKKARPDTVPYAMMTKNNGSLSPEFQVWLWTYGGRILDDAGNVSVNSAAGVRALSMMVDLLRENLAATDIDRPDARRMFGQRQAVFYNDAPLARGFARTISGLGEKFDREVVSVATPVLAAGQTPQSFAWVHLLALINQPGEKITATSPQAALIKFLATDEAVQLRYFKEVGMFPVTGNALNRLFAVRYVTDWAVRARGARRDDLSFWPNAADTTTIVGEEVQAALLQKKTPLQAIETMQKRLETTMNQVRSAA